jgi:hypothetical protein
MLSQTGIFTILTVANLALISFPANSQTIQQEGNQDAYIQGNDNEINQTINQYYLNNPGKGVIKRREPQTETSNWQNPSNNNSQPNNSNNREWGQVQGEQNRNPKK